MTTAALAPASLNGPTRQVPRLGIASHSVPDVERLSVPEILARAHDLGLDGCVFMNPLQISPTLDPGALREARAIAEDLGIYLEIGLGRISPYHFSARGEVLAVGAGDFRAGLVRMIEANCAIGCTEQFFWVGSPADRVSRTIPWDEQVRATREFLSTLAPPLRDLGCHLNIKTHGEDPTSQVVETVEIVGPDVLGIAFDPADTCGSLEDPIAATERVAPYVRILQADDLLLAFTDDGLTRISRPCGAGVLDWPAILAILRERTPAFTVNVELHRATANMPIFNREWLAFQEGLPLAEFAETIWLAHLSEQRLASGEVAPLAAYAVREDRLADSAAYLRAALERAYVPI